MVSVSELLKIEGILRRGEQTRENPRMCKEYIGRLRMWLAAGRSPTEVRRRLEQLISRFGNVRF